jgi:hypothetical protein
MRKPILLALCAPLLILQTTSAQVLQNFEIVGRYFYGDTARGEITGVCTDGDFLFVSEGFDSVKVYDISETNLPVEQIGATYCYGADNLYKYGDVIACLKYSYWGGFSLLDVSDPTNPILRGWGGGSIVAHLVIKDSLAFVPFEEDFVQSGFKIYNISDLNNLVQLDACYSEPCLGFDIDARDSLAYMSSMEGFGLTVFSVADAQNIRIAFRNFEGYVGPVKLYGGLLYTGPSLERGGRVLRIYSLIDPVRPASIFEFPFAQTSSSSLEIRDGCAYVFEPSASLEVIDMGGFDFPDSLAAFRVNWSGVLWLPQVAINEDIVYLAAGDSGLYVLRYTGPMPINTGDANGNGELNGIDVVYLVSYLKGGPAIPGPQERGDANGDCEVNGMDVLYLVNYFKGLGEEPIRAFCYGH